MWCSSELCGYMSLRRGRGTGGKGEGELIKESLSINLYVSAIDFTFEGRVRDSTSLVLKEFFRLSSSQWVSWS